MYSFGFLDKFNVYLRLQCSMNRMAIFSKTICGVNFNSALSGLRENITLTKTYLPFGVKMCDGKIGVNRRC